MKILVTGSSGLVGSQVVKDLVSQNHEVYSCYNDAKPSHGIPVITGIYYNNFKDIVEEMDAEDAIIIAGGPGSLRENVMALLKDENMAESIGSRGRNLVENYRGLGVRVASELIGRIK